MRRFRATYEVTYYGDVPKLPADRFAQGLAAMAAIDENALLDSRAEPEDDLAIASFDPISGPSGTTPVRYVADHQVQADSQPVTAKRVERRLAEVLGIPQQERTAFDITAVTVEEVA